MPCFIKRCDASRDRSLIDLGKQLHAQPAAFQRPNEAVSDFGDYRHELPIIRRIESADGLLYQRVRLAECDMDRSRKADRPDAIMWRKRACGHAGNLAALRETAEPARSICMSVGMAAASGRAACDDDQRLQQIDECAGRDERREPDDLAGASTAWRPGHDGG